MAHYEIEVKSLLGAKSAAEALLDRMRTLDSGTELRSKNTQLNHYFTGGDIQTLFEKTKHLFDQKAIEKFEAIASRGTSFSVRTRKKDDEVLLVVKASLDEGTSENTVSRLEFEEVVSISLEALDELVLASGFTYQAKWSRTREEYAYKGANVCLDKNAGYGYLAEFEKVVADEADAGAAREEIEAMMRELGVAELPQDRLERMFAFYNEHWPEYYGTEKTFTIE